MTTHVTLYLPEVAALRLAENWGGEYVKTIGDCGE